MNRKQKQPTPVQRLVAAMDRCAVARGEAQWTHGYRSRFEATPNHDTAEADRLAERNMKQWVMVDAAERNFQRLAARLLREARGGQR